MPKDAKEESKEINNLPEQKDMLGGEGEEGKEDIDMEAKELVSSGRPLVFFVMSNSYFARHLNGC